MEASLVTIPGTWTAGFLERPGVRLRYHRTGRGDKPALVLLHGATDNGLCWYRLARDLDSDYDIVMPDARGHGHTQTDAAAFTLSDMVDDTANLIEQLGLAPATIIGHSMGAQIATELAARYPELVERIVLEDPAYKMSASGGPRMLLFSGAMRLGMRWMRRRSPQQIPRLADRLFKKLSDDDKNSWADAQYQSSRNSIVVALKNVFDRNRDWTVSLRKIDAPTLLVTADKGLIKSDEADRIMAALQHGSRAHICRAGHNVRRDNYTDFTNALREFHLTS